MSESIAVVSQDGTISLEKSSGEQSTDQDHPFPAGAIVGVTAGFVALIVLVAITAMKRRLRRIYSTLENGESQA